MRFWNRIFYFVYKIIFKYEKKKHREKHKLFEMSNGIQCSAFQTHKQTHTPFLINCLLLWIWFGDCGWGCNLWF